MDQARREHSLGMLRLLKLVAGSDKAPSLIALSRHVHSLGWGTRRVGALRSSLSTAAPREDKWMTLHFFCAYEVEAFSCGQLDSLQPVALQAASTTEARGFLVRRPREHVKDWAPAIAFTAALLTAAEALHCDTRDREDALAAPMPPSAFDPDLDKVAKRGGLGKDQLPRMMQLFVHAENEDLDSEERVSLLRLLSERVSSIRAFLDEQHPTWPQELQMQREKWSDGKWRWVKKCHVDRWRTLLQVGGCEAAAAPQPAATETAAVPSTSSLPSVGASLRLFSEKPSRTESKRLAQRSMRLAQHGVAHAVVLIKEPKPGVNKLARSHQRLFTLRKVDTKERYQYHSLADADAANSSAEGVASGPQEWEICYYEELDYEKLQLAGPAAKQTRPHGTIPLRDVHSVSAVLSRYRQLDRARMPLEPSIEITMAEANGKAGRVYKLRAPDGMKPRAKVERLQKLLVALQHYADEQIEEHECCTIVSDFQLLLDIASNRRCARSRLALPPSLRTRLTLCEARLTLSTRARLLLKVHPVEWDDDQGLQPSTGPPARPNVLRGRYHGHRRRVHRWSRARPPRAALLRPQ